MKTVMTIGSTAVAEKRPPLVIPALSSSAATALLVTVSFMIGDGIDFSLVLVAAVAFVIALLFSALLGIPYALLLQRLGRLRWLPMLAGGFTIGALPYLGFVLGAFSSLAVTREDHIIEILVFAGMQGLAGAVGAAAFFFSQRYLLTRAAR